MLIWCTCFCGPDRPQSPRDSHLGWCVSGSLGKVAPPPFPALSLYMQVYVTHSGGQCMENCCEINQPVPIDLGKLTVWWKMFSVHPLANSDISNLTSSF